LVEVGRFEGASMYQMLGGGKKGTKEKKKQPQEGGGEFVGKRRTKGKLGRLKLGYRLRFPQSPEEEKGAKKGTRQRGGRNQGEEKRGGMLVENSA